ncbi:MAG: enoyl-CoA hydratase [Spirochaetaceae bacterium]|nr:enoyl-CoA hydratase [Spirochaetaceae bacterium]
MQFNTDKMLAEVDGGIGWLTYNNPARHNAVSLEMWEAQAAILECFQNDDDVRVVVLRGAGGKAFVSGADISEFETKRATAEQREHYANVSAAAGRWLNKLDKPLIAMIQGYCIGGGLATALAADVRFATPGSQFGIPAAKLGLGYGYGGIAALARLVGPSVARDILFSARRLDAEEALRVGLVNFIVDDDALEARVREYAGLVSANAPLTVRLCKAAVNEFERDPGERDLARLDEMVIACFDSDDYKEGRRAFMEKRRPNFRGA